MPVARAVGISILASVVAAEPGEGEDYLESLSLDSGSGADPEQESSIPVHGLLTLRYRGRSNGSEDMHDLLGYASVDVGAAGVNPYSFHVRASGRAELSASDGRNSFDGILQTFSDSAYGLLYDAYVDAHNFSDLTLARLGRQSDYLTPAIAIYDGAHIETRGLGSANVRLGGYGGLAVRQYDQSGKDPLYGLYVEGQPWRAGRARLDWMHSEDETVFGDVRDDMLSISLWQTMLTKLRLEGFYSRLDSEDRDVRLRGTWSDPAEDFSVQLGYYQLLQAQGFNSTEFDPFSYVAGVWYPFTQVTLLATKGIGEHFGLQAGIDTRNVDDQDDIGTYNRDVDRYYLTANLLQLSSSGTTVSITGDLWRGSGRDIQSWGADLRQPLGSRFEGAVGTYYSLYKTDLLTGVEHEDVRTFYGKLEYEASQAMTYDVGYEYEDTNFEDYHQVKLRMAWRF